MTEKDKERYKSYRSSPIVIKFPIEIDDKEYDALRTCINDRAICSKSGYCNRT